MKRLLVVAALVAIVVAVVPAQASPNWPAALRTTGSSRSTHAKLSPQVRSRPQSVREARDADGRDDEIAPPLAHPVEASSHGGGFTREAPPSNTSKVARPRVLAHSTRAVSAKTSPHERGAPLTGRISNAGRHILGRHRRAWAERSSDGHQRTAGRTTTHGLPGCCRSGFGQDGRTFRISRW
jgi:hypothetical protein